MDHAELIKSVEAAVSNGDTDKAIDLLMEDRDKFDDESFQLINSLSGRYKSYLSKNVQGLLKSEDSTTEHNQIRNGILELLKILKFIDKKAKRAERMKKSLEYIYAEVKQKSRKNIAFIVHVGDVRHSVSFYTNFVQDGIFVDDKLIHKERNYFKYANQYDFTLAGGTYEATLRLVVKFSIWTGLIKRFQMVSTNSILCEGKF